MSRLLIKNGTLVGLNDLAEDSAVLCCDGKIDRIGPSAELESAQADAIIDATDCYIAPGFIDLHFHGTHRCLIDNGPDDLAQLCTILPQYGVTSFLPAVCPRPKGEDSTFLQTLTGVKSEGTSILGFHLEGPFLTMTGALPSDALGDADPDRLRALIDAARPYNAVFSVSPDFDGILDLLPIMTENGAPVFMTHSGANIEQAQSTIDAGARHATHFYDVFPAPEETDPGVRPVGLVECILADPRVSVDFILDGEHVEPVAVKMALECKGPDRVCLITDANVGAGLPPGRHTFAGGEEIEFSYAGGPARLTENTHMPGGLAGSGLTMDHAVRNAVKLLDVDIPQAVRMATANPARVLGLDDVKGQMCSDYDADIVLLDDALNVVQTLVGGRCCYSAQG